MIIFLLFVLVWSFGFFFGGGDGGGLFFLFFFFLPGTLKVYSALACSESRFFFFLSSLSRSYPSLKVFRYLQTL